MGTRWGCLLALGWGFFLFACEDDEPPPEPPVESEGEVRIVVQCEADADCDDGLYCNGTETCDTNAGRCVAGERVVCDDGIECTRDVCREEIGDCESTPPDADGDGHGDIACLDDDGTPLGDDCDDADPARFPGNTEVCDAEHHDEDCQDSTFGLLDADGDGVYNANCCNENADGELTCGRDCDDANENVHPGATEACDGFDNDCNGTLDHPLEDQDGDGVGNAICGGTDCDDLDPNTFAGATEICDGVDNNCSVGGGPDDAEVDHDGDGYVVVSCEPIDDESLQPNDCTDSNPSAYPGADELCNGIDDDCDGRSDEDAGDCGLAIRQIDSAYGHTCAVRQDGKVACWGRNSNGHLGTGSTSYVDDPEFVLDSRESDLMLAQVKRVTTGDHHSCALHFDKRVSCWGENTESGELGLGTFDALVNGPTHVPGLNDIVDVGAGYTFTCALDESGDVYCWGNGYSGQLGQGSLGVSATSPSPLKVTEVSDAVNLSVGETYACAVLRDGHIKCWGINDDGQIGDTTWPERATPVQIFGVDDAVQVAAGGSHTCARTRQGHLRCWGNNSRGQVGNGELSPVVLRPEPVLNPDGAPLADVVDISVSGSFFSTDAAYGTSCARLKNGTLVCWGDAKTGMIGNGLVYGVQTFPEDAVFGVEALDVSLGEQEACAVTQTGKVMCWGGYTPFFFEFGPSEYAVAKEIEVMP